MSSYKNTTPARANAYEDTGDSSAYVRGAPGVSDRARVETMASPSIDITNMSNNNNRQQQQQHQYMPYAGAYSESAGNIWNQQAAARDSMISTGKQKNSLDEVPSGRHPYGSSGAVGAKRETYVPDYGSSDSHSFVGFRTMSHWHVVRFIFYVGTRLAQLVVALVCIAFLADSRHKRPYESVDTTERNTEVAVFVIGGVTAVTAAISIVLHLFAKTRRKVEKSRLSWFTMVFNFAVFVVWIILVLINVIVVDCSGKVDGTWCRDIKISSATGLVSAMLALVVVLRSFSVLVRVGKINMSSSRS
ncbi:hypothetical protein J3B02_000607 [Coemansia erecta]|uniref:MARVEL domain-containing protein n=1 Tax=Coemansia asiatica TaxID=1052880 RepID=A0A9W7XNP6_9FUNG|nr:hypothetical protein LPJ64_001594 [Coemansia asiatica]KAJ2857983.1 hypothetical protein J3B02_000607 [Coemansia erecta]KAJ2872193.1 hypothetical protein FB639_004376 [Coemansia asiatica]